jgi:pimeloyl-ACP methyl ester carboxylesterase
MIERTLGPGQTGGYPRRAIVVSCLAAIWSTATPLLAQSAATDPCAHPGRRFVETAVTVGSDTDGLIGALTRPCGPGPFPAAVIVGGSGPTDRDGTSPEPGARVATPYRDLGRGLAARGVVVLRYDKRFCDHPQEFPATSEYTVAEEYLRDAGTAIALLQHRPEVDPARVFVVGHSEGGTVAPRIALGTSVAGVVLLAAAVEPLQDALLRQVTYLANLDGPPNSCEQTFVDEAASTAACVRSLPSSTTDTCRGVPRSYWLDLAAHNPAADAHALSQPILALQGGRDYQVIPSLNFDVLRQRLADRSADRFILVPARSRCRGTARS